MVVNFLPRVTQNKYFQMLIHSLCAVVNGRKMTGPNPWESSILGCSPPLQSKSQHYGRAQAKCQRLEWSPALSFASW